MGVTTRHIIPIFAVFTPRTKQKRKNACECFFVSDRTARTYDAGQDPIWPTPLGSDNLSSDPPLDASTIAPSSLKVGEPLNISKSRRHDVIMMMMMMMLDV